MVSPEHEAQLDAFDTAYEHAFADLMARRPRLGRPAIRNVLLVSAALGTAYTGPLDSPELVVTYDRARGYEVREAEASGPEPSEPASVPDTHVVAGRTYYLPAI